MNRKNRGLSRVVVKKLLLAVLMFPAILASGTSHAKYCSPKINNSGETCSYRYELVLNKNDKVCKHMKQVFDSSFARPFDLYGFSRKQKEEVLFPIESHYPSSDEFEAISWKNLMVIDELHGQKFSSPLPMAQFDIDNDGEADVVFKSVWFSGEKDSTESLVFFKKGEIDPNKLSEWGEIYGQPGNRPRVIGFAARIIRPFILDKVSYLMMYKSTGRGAFWGEQTMWVRKYKSGGTIPEPYTLELEDICKFNMIRYD